MSVDVVFASDIIGKELNTLRGNWAWGIVEEPHFSRDGIVRAVTVRTTSKDGKPNRHIFGVSRLAFIADGKPQTNPQFFHLILYSHIMV